MSKIILSTGGTGGHFFAAIAVYDELIKQGFDPLIIADERCKKYANNERSDSDYIYKIQFMDFKYDSSSRINKLKLSFRIFCLIFHMRKILSKFQPVLVIGFGGYTTCPSVISAYLLAIPIIIHEQNSCLGKANKFLTFFANKVTVSYRELLENNNEDEDKYVFVGQVVRNTIVRFNLAQRFSKPFSITSNNIFRLFIFGGSQGAKSFTEIVPKAIEIVINNTPDMKLHITQQVSDVDKDKLEKIYNKLPITFNLANFFFNIIKIYEETDLVIARSGASTIGELCKMGMPSILIPYPYSAEDHQLYNAKLLEGKEAAICLDSKSLTPEILAEKIMYLNKNPEILKKMSENLQNISTDGAKRIVDTVIKKLL